MRKELIVNKMLVSLLPIAINFTNEANYEIQSIQF